jgi:hypothetical protein
MPMELPPTPFYRRWSVLLAGVIAVAAFTAMLGWRGLSDADQSPTTLTTAPATTRPPTTTTEPPPSIEPTSKPDDIIWERLGSGASSERSVEFRAPSTWRIIWSFDCSNFASHGGGNFKITGTGSLEWIDIQNVAIRADGTQSYRRGGFGHLNVETVCDRWTVRVLSG